MRSARISLRMRPRAHADAHIGHNAPMRFAYGPTALGCGDAVIGGQRQLQAGAEAMAFHGGNHRHGQVAPGQRGVLKTGCDRVWPAPDNTVWRLVGFFRSAKSMPAQKVWPLPSNTTARRLRLSFELPRCLHELAHHLKASWRFSCPGRASCTMACAAAPFDTQGVHFDSPCFYSSSSFRLWE